MKIEVNNARDRAKLLAMAEQDPIFAAMLRARCKRDVVFFIKLCLWTFDPRIKNRLRRYKPFLLFKRQEEYVQDLVSHMADGTDLLVEKSRDTGATWCTLAVLLHGWLFEPGFQALIGSRKEDQVDKAGDPSSMFWKLDFMIQSLPSFMYPNGFKKAPPYRTYLKLENPATGSTITGESSNSDFGRGGRYTIIFLDEFAAWEWAGAAWTSCSESTTCRVPVSTPKGMNFFGRLANSSSEDAIDKFRIHWSDDDRHNITVFDEKKGVSINPWLEKQRRKFAYDPAMMAQELDINYNKSVKGRVYPQMDHSKSGRFKRNLQYPLYIGWDFGLTDQTALVWAQYNLRSNRFEWLDAYQNSGQTIDFYIPFVTGEIGDMPYDYTEAEIAKIKSHRGWRADEHFGDPAGRQRNQVTNTSVIDELAKKRPNAGAPNGIHVTTNTKAIAFETRRTATQLVLMRSDFDTERTAGLMDALRNSRFPEVPEGTNSTTINRLPVHDWTSHLRTAVEFLCVNQLHGDADLNDDNDVIDSEQPSAGAFVGGRFIPGARVHPLVDEDEDYTTEYRGKAGY